MYGPRIKYIQSIYFHLSPRKTSINPLNLAQMQKPQAVSESAGPDSSGDVENKIPVIESLPQLQL